MIIMAKEEKKSATYRPRSLLPKDDGDNTMITCFGKCGISQKKLNFYRDWSESSPLGVVPYCKKCIKTMVLNDDKTVNLENFKKLLKNQNIDRPFLDSVWDSALNAKGDTIGNYFKILSLNNNRELTWKDGDNPIEANKDVVTGQKKDYVVENFQSNEPIIITDDMVRTWGLGYTPEQYISLTELYIKFSRDFEIDTGVQDEYLKNACICQMRNKKALAEGDTANAGKWGNQFDSYMASGKLKPNQISASDKMGGITNFATFFQYIEKSEDFIPDFPDIILDDIDYAMYAYVNYVREFMGSQKMELGEVKDFMTYDYERGQEIVFPKKEDE